VVTAYVYAAGKSRRILEIMYRAARTRPAPGQVETLAGARGGDVRVPAAPPL